MPASVCQPRCAYSGESGDPFRKTPNRYCAHSARVHHRRTGQEDGLCGQKGIRKYYAELGISPHARKRGAALTTEGSHLGGEGIGSPRRTQIRTCEWRISAERDSPCVNQDEESRRCGLLKIIFRRYIRIGRSPLAPPETRFSNFFSTCFHPLGRVGRVTCWSKAAHVSGRAEVPQPKRNTHPSVRRVAATRTAYFLPFFRGPRRKWDLNWLNAAVGCDNEALVPARLIKV